MNSTLQFDASYTKCHNIIICRFIKVTLFVCIIIIIPFHFCHGLKNGTSQHERVESETKLYNFIKQRNWENAFDTIQSNLKEASILIERRNASGGIKERHYPLHVVFSIDVQNDSIENVNRKSMSADQALFCIELLKAYPQAASQKDLYHRTPLHLALSSSVVPTLDVISAIYSAYPQATQSRDREKRLPLHAAVSNPTTSFENVQFILQRYPGAVTIMDEDEAYPIHLLAWGGDYDDSLPILKLLYETNPDTLLTKDGDNETPLTLMAKYGQTSADALKFVINKNPQGLSNDRDENEGNTVLHFAVSAGHGNGNSLFEPFLLAQPKAVERINRYGMTPLHSALWKCCVPSHVILRLLEVYPKGASLKDGMGYLPIHYACQEGITDIVIIEKLLSIFPEGTQKFSSPKNEESEGSLPLHIALLHSSNSKNMTNRMNKVVSSLLEYYPDGAKVQDSNTHLYPIHLAILSARPTTVIKKIAQIYPESLSIDVDGPPQTGLGKITAFNLLAIVGSNFYKTNSVKDLLHTFIQLYPNGVERVDSYQRILLHYAWHSILHGDDSYDMAHVLVDILLETNPHVANVVDGDMKLPLMYACEARDVVSVDRLLQIHPKGAKFQSVDGSLPLHYACKTPLDMFNASNANASHQIISQLLEIYPEAAAIPDNTGNLPMHNLCLSVGVEQIPRDTIQLLLDANPNVTKIHGRGGCLPLHQAIRAALTCNDLNEAPYIVDMVDLLLSFDVSSAFGTDMYGRTALAHLFEFLDGLSSLRLADNDPLLKISQMIYSFDSSKESLLRLDGKKRNALHFIGIFVGNVGGSLSKEWSSFLQTIVMDLQEDALCAVDTDKRTPLHLLTIYLGDSAVASRDNQDRQTMQLTPELSDMVEAFITACPDAIEYQEKFNLSPFDLMVHKRLQTNKKAFSQSSIIQYVKKLLNRGVTYWKLVKELRQLESTFQKEMVQSQITATRCNNLGTGLLVLHDLINEELINYNLDLNIVANQEFTCVERHYDICSLCPDSSQELAMITIKLSRIAQSYDNDIIMI